MGMTSKVTKRKLYWVLLIPSVFISIIALILLPEAKKLFSIYPLIFWIVYYGVIKIIDLKTKKENGDI